MFVAEADNTSLEGPFVQRAQRGPSNAMIRAVISISLTEAPFMSSPWSILAMPSVQIGFSLYDVGTLMFVTERKGAIQEESSVVLFSFF